MQRCLGCMRLFGKEYDVCPHCGYIVGTPAASKNHLAPGTTLQDGHFTLGRALGQGGFGITYIAWDNTIGRAVAIKEYLPNVFASRMTGEKEVSCYNEEVYRQFRLGLEKTRREANALSRFDALESVVKVYDCIEENGTAYIIMELLRGKTVKEILEEHGTLSFAETMRIMTPVLQTLDAMHKVGMIHRDVAPDNIFVCEDGRIKLLDFGAARVVSGTDEKTLSVTLKHGYAPVEQYSGKSKQGAYTDVYAASATICKMLTGETPPDSLGRATGDDDLCALLSKSDAPSNAQKTVLHGMAVNADDRIQSAQDLLVRLQEDAPESFAGIDPRKFLHEQKVKKAKATLRIVLAAALAVLAISFSAYMIHKAVSGKPVSEPTGAGETASALAEKTASEEGAVSLTADQLEEKLKETVGEEYEGFYCKDYNADGRLEAFALAVESTEEVEGTELVFADVGLYFVSGDQVTKVNCFDGLEYPDIFGSINGRTVQLTADEKYYGYAVFCAPGNWSFEEVYCVDREGNPKHSGLSSGGSISFSEYGWLAGNIRSWTDRGAGRSYKEYYAYYDTDRCSFVEYGAVPLTVEQLYAVPGADKALEYIDKSSIRTVLFRANNSIHITLERAGSETQDYQYTFFLINGKLSTYNKNDEFWNQHSDTTGVALDCSAAAFAPLTVFPQTYPDGKTPAYNSLKDFIQKYQTNYVGAHVPWYYPEESAGGAVQRSMTYRTHYLDVDGDGEEECFLAVHNGESWNVQLFDYKEKTVWLVQEWGDLSETEYYSAVLEVRQDKDGRVVMILTSGSDTTQTTAESVYDGTDRVDRLTLYAQTEDYVTKYYSVDAAHHYFFDLTAEEFRISEFEYNKLLKSMRDAGTVVFSYGKSD